MGEIQNQPPRLPFNPSLKVDFLRFTCHFRNRPDPGGRVGRALIQVACGEGDPHTQFPLIQVPHLNTRPLVDLLKRTPDLRVKLLNGGRGGRGVREVGRVYVDIATVEEVAGLAHRLPRSRPQESSLVALIPSSTVSRRC